MQFYTKFNLILINIKVLAIYCKTSILAMHFLYEKNKDHHEHKKIAQKKKVHQTGSVSEDILEERSRVTQ